MSFEHILPTAFSNDSLKKEQESNQVITDVKQSVHSVLLLIMICMCGFLAKIKRFWPNRIQTGFLQEITLLRLP